MFWLVEVYPAVVGELGGVIEQLTDRHEVVSTGAHETLTLGLSDRR